MELGRNSLPYGIEDIAPSAPPPGVQGGLTVEVAHHTGLPQPAQLTGWRRLDFLSS